MKLVATLAIALFAGTLALACGGAEDEDMPAGDTATPGGPSPTPTSSADDAQLRLIFSGWPNTDPSTLTVPTQEIRRGCIGKDCIPALDAEGAVSSGSDTYGVARFAPVDDVDYEPAFPVAYFTVNGETRGYPLHILTFHEIVNDVVGDEPVAMTYCPLCNSALGFERSHRGEVLEFGVSGNLRNSDLIMFDRQTESWWQQVTGEAIAGEYAGDNLVPIAVSVLSFADFAASFPDAMVLTEETGIYGSYGVNPYENYDATGSRPFLYSGEYDERLDALERVVALSFGDEQLAVPFSALSDSPAANVAVDGEQIAVFWVGGTKSVLDTAQIREARDVGTGVAYSRTVDGETLNFTAGSEPGKFTDRETGSTWTIAGEAIEGPLAGSRLAAVEHTTQFWFSWAAFFPETGVWSPEA